MIMHSAGAGCVIFAKLFNHKVDERMFGILKCTGAIQSLLTCLYCTDTIQMRWRCTYV